MEVIRIIRYSGNPTWIERTMDTSIKEDLVFSFGTVQAAAITGKDETKELSAALKRMRKERR